MFAYDTLGGFSLLGEVVLLGEIGTISLSEWKRIKITQFTGFLDRNGTEIYFDDIVRFTFNDARDSESTWNGTATIARTLNNGVGLLCDYENANSHIEEVYAVSEGGVIQEYWDDEDLWEIEIIGNIYENPELLKI